jgi:hypothetical protein
LGQIYKILEGQQSSASSQLRWIAEQPAGTKAAIHAAVLEAVEKIVSKVEQQNPKHLYEQLDTLETEVLEDSPSNLKAEFGVDCLNINKPLPSLQGRGKSMIGWSAAPGNYQDTEHLPACYNTIKELQVAKSQQVAFCIITGESDQNLRYKA